MSAVWLASSGAASWTGGRGFCDTSGSRATVSAYPTAGISLIFMGGRDDCDCQHCTAGVPPAKRRESRLPLLDPAHRLKGSQTVQPSVQPAYPVVFPPFFAVFAAWLAACRSARGARAANPESATPTRAESVAGTFQFKPRPQS